MNEIIPNLYISDYYDVVYNFDEKIKRVVNCAKEFKNIRKIPKEDYLQLQLEDSGTFEDEILFYQSIRPFLKFMDTKPFDEYPTVVHCQMGVSRSCSMVAVYLLHKEMFLTLSEAQDYIVTKRPQAFSSCRMNYANAINDYFGTFLEKVLSK